MEKKEIRRLVKEARRKYPEALLEEESRKICARVARLPEFQEADTIYVYIGCRGEVSTRFLIEEAFRLGKRAAAPKVLQGEEASMEYEYFSSFEQLEEGAFGIPEPTTGETADDPKALLIVPGVGFDGQRNRCGYGKGYYDAYLSAHPEHCTVALAFDFQMVDEVLTRPEDIRPQYLITQTRFLADPDVLLDSIGAAAKRTSPVLAKLDTASKNRALLCAADALLKRSGEILKANEEDVRRARANQMHEGLVDRLMLNEARIASMAEGLRQIAALDDPVGEVEQLKRRPNGLMIGKKRVPLGVIGMIYESRPNVTADAFGLCFKTSNAVILKGGSDAIFSNTAIVRILQSALGACSLPESAVQLIPVTDRAATAKFMRLKEYIDVLIPRGGAGLIRAVVENSTVPVIETGTGNCHIYVDESADLSMAIEIINNAKTQRIGVCNACESIVVHERIEKELLGALKKRLDEHQVEMRCDAAALSCVEGGVPASEEDWGREYLDYILSVKTVSSLDEAIAHINRYNTGHSEAIITENYTNALRFLDEVDAAAVYVNASTRFTDGFEFGFGAEIGISTQKLHARGPMGLEALTTTKFIIFGNGQVRP